MMWGYGFSWPGMLFMSLGSLLWIALLVVLVWAIVRWFNKRNGATVLPTSTPSATEVLRQRFARGEIDAATFEQMKAQLQEREPLGTR